MNQRTRAERISLREQLRLVWQKLRGGRLSPRRAALSVALGLFIGATPFYGFQLLLILLFCIPLRLDTPVAYLAAHFSNPLTFPFIVGAEIEIGSYLLTGRHAQFSWEHAEAIGLGGYALQLAIGAPMLGAVLAAAGGTVTLLVSRRRAGGMDPLTAAVDRTVRRYRSASRRERFYVRGKLDGDPALRALAVLPGSFGRLTDAGCGLAQVSLCLYELGRTTELFGFDPDEQAIAVARNAAKGVGEYQISRFRDADWRTADTVLFIDSLHYADITTQEAALERAAESLVAGGRMIIRDVNRRARWRSWLTRILERLAVFFGIRHAAKITFRSSEQLIDTLEALGLSCVIIPPVEWSPFENVLIVATKGGAPSAEPSEGAR